MNKITTFKPGKYASHAFSLEQKKARSWRRRAQEHEARLMDAMMLINNGPRSRKEMHTKLDKQLNEIESLNKRAEALFPDVAKSFTISSGTIREWQNQ